MICEDDIEFTKSGIFNINYILNNNNFDYNKPILIRLAKGFCKNHSLNKTPYLNKNIIMSNPCFLINSYYAITFLKNLKQINMTSDMYIHRFLIKIDKNIDHYTLFPIPIYELSTNKFKKFSSTIIPKGSDINNVIKKKYYRDFLILASPRSGTGSASHFLKLLDYNVGHEKMKSNGISSWMLAVESNNYPFQKYINNNEFYYKNIIQIVRDPFKMIPSMILENKYSPNNKSYIFRRNFINKIFNINLPLESNNLISDIEIAIQTYIYWNKIIEKKNPTLLIKLEELNKLNIFLKNVKKIENKIIKNNNKLYNGKRIK